MCREDGFTISRPRIARGHRPAGLQHCDEDTIHRWEMDSHRFPPYQYLPRHCLVNKAGLLHIPNIVEKEYMMGLPVGYAQMCLPKGQRKSTEYQDKRLTLVGNGWSVPVVAGLIGELVGPRGRGARKPPWWNSWGDWSLQKARTSCSSARRTKYRAISDFDVQ